LSNLIESVAVRRSINQFYDVYFWDPVHLEYYDGDYSNYGYWGDGARTQRAACDALVDRLCQGLPESAHVLDVACGKGASTRRLSERFAGGHVTAINISKSQIMRTADNAPDGSVLLMDAARLGFADAQFDAVVSV